MSRNGIPTQTDAAHRADAAGRRLADRPTFRTGPGTNTATASASGACSKVFDDFKIPAVLAINGSALAAYPPIVEAALERNWEFMGHGFTQRNMQKVENERDDIRKTADVIEAGDRQAAARLARPRPHRDLGDAGSAEARKATITSPTGCSTTSRSG